MTHAPPTLRPAFRPPFRSGLPGAFPLMASGASYAVPAAPILSLQTAYDRGASSSDGITNETNPGFDIGFLTSPQVGDVITLKNSGTPVGSPVTLTADHISGATPIDFNNTFTDATYSFTVTHKRGTKESAASNAVSYTLNTSLGAFDSVALNTNGTNPTIDIDFTSTTLAENDFIEVRRASDGLLLKTHTITAGEDTADAATITLDATTLAFLTEYVCKVSGYDASDNMTDAADFTFNCMPAEAIHWFDASDEDTINNSGSNVLSWDDKIGSALFDRIAAYPQTGESAQDINGLNTIRVDGTLINAGLLENFAADDVFTFYFMASIDAINSTVDSLISIRDTTSGENVTQRANNASQFDGNLVATTATNDAWTGGPYSGLHLFTLRFNGTAGTISIEVDGTEVASASDHADVFTTDTDIRLFVDHGTGFSVAGRICDFVYCTGDAAEEAALEAALNSKWGL